MLKARSSRSVFLSSAILVLALGVMLIGGTFAWGVNYAENDQAEELTGNQGYHVDLQYRMKDSEYASLIGTNAAAFTSDMLWCPGKTEIVYLKLKNEEAFPVDCTLSLYVTNTGFDNTLTYAVIEELTPSSEDHPKNWSEFKDMANGDTVLSQGNHTLFTRQPLAPSSGEYDLALAIHMAEDASSDYQRAEMYFNFKLQVEANFGPGATPAAPDN